MVSGYVEDINENNITGLVLAACELNELKQVELSGEMLSFCGSSFRLDSFDDLW